jgi:hypothetical protein
MVLKFTFDENFTSGRLIIQQKIESSAWQQRKKMLGKRHYLVKG